jgi:hypothetical protein
VPASRGGGKRILRLEVNGEFEFLRLLDGQIAWIGSFQNSVDVCCREPETSK